MLISLWQSGGFHRCEPKQTIQTRIVDWVSGGTVEELLESFFRPLHDLLFVRSTTTIHKNPVSIFLAYHQLLLLGE